MGEFDNYIETFRQEADELLADIEQCVLTLEENPDDMDTVNRLFRAMHTIKGSGSMFGFTDVASFTHHVETVLDKVRDGKVPVSKELIDLVLASRDQILSLLNAVDGGSGADLAAGEQIVQGLNALIPGNQPATGAGASESEPTECNSDGEAVMHICSLLMRQLVCPAYAEERARATEARKIEATRVKLSKDASTNSGVSTYRISFTPKPELFRCGTDPALLLEELHELGDCDIIANTSKLPSLQDMNPEDCYLGWEVVLNTTQDKNAINDVFIFVEDIADISIEQISDSLSVELDGPLPKLGEILVDRGLVDPDQLQAVLESKPRIGETLANSGLVSKEQVEAALMEQKALERQQSAAKTETVRVPADKLDQLINLVGELVITQAQLAQVATSLESLELATPVEEIERLTADLRDVALNIRMMPIGTTFGRFKRLVRDMSVELGKEIELITEGAETELDKTVIDRLGDPLVHLIRNSIDHGIEQPDVRAENGKSSRGTIKLVAAHRGAHVVITIEDDGKGLDTEVIRRKGIDKGLISADADLTDQEIFGLIFEPGFSTAEKVTNVSGRGVGMDVVRREIDALRGSIQVRSNKGQGTVIDLSLPLTLAIIEGLLVEVGEEKFVIPLSLVEECLELTEDRYALSSDRHVIQVRGEAVPFVRLRESFKISSSTPSLEETVVVSANDNRLGLVVDRVIGHHQTVIKSLGSSYKNVEAISGATILGDGTVALILDIVGLLKLANAEERQAVELANSAPASLAA